MPSPPPRRLPGNDHAKPNKHVPSAKYLNIPWPRQKAIIAGKHANASNPRSQVIPQIALIIATPKPPHLAASFFLFRTRDVRYWHLTDKPPAPGFVAYWTNNGQKAALGLDLSAANDPKRSSGPDDSAYCAAQLGRKRVLASQPFMAAGILGAARY
jgi:hypothetical protein